MAAKWSFKELPGALLALTAWMEGALGTISISAVRLDVTSTCSSSSVAAKDSTQQVKLSETACWAQAISARPRCSCMPPEPAIQQAPFHPRITSTKHTYTHTRTRTPPAPAHLVGPQPQRQLRLLEDVEEGCDELHGQQLLPAVVPALHDHAPKVPPRAPAVRRLALQPRALGRPPGRVRGSGVMCVGWVGCVSGCKI